MQSNSIEIPYIQNDDRSAGKVYKNILLYWTDELGSKTASKPKFGQAKLKLEKLIGMCYSSDELLEDSPISIEPLINNLFADAFAWTFDWVLLNGTGAG
ncbi:MAG: phage major capsid protein, partial [candidate division Zixibacteria bacterium]|nr:phage major capsid protein [Phycisphaerae bacterium]NIR27698.1 phage major capsid protein [Gammaproteobacteria bacterium]NIR68101.1 phage major capsid protein [candidate division Zixibacteria bacterium]NIW98072.1 phage major capsid protein [Phycisphaerae bacterium]